MSIPKEMKAWILNERPTDAILPSTFRLDTVPAPQADELKEGEYIVKTLALSNDPAQRTWMDDSFDPKRMYHPPIMKGDQISSSVYGQVVASKAKSVKEGDHMVIGGKWAEYCKVAESPFNTPAKHIKGQSEYVSLGILGMTGLTAYVGAYGELDLKPEHTVVISGAAGAVGSTLVQIAKKIIGCKKVVGLAGGKQKCDWVKSLGADVCIDYKDKDYPKHLKDALPDFADSYFDNVGGDILNEMLGLLKRGGKIAACGAISGYNDKGFTLTKWGEVIFNRYTIHGFIFFDHPNLVVKGREDMAKWFDEGKLTNGEGETVVETKFEDIPKTYQKLFEGGNQGKLITKLV